MVFETTAYTVPPTRPPGNPSRPDIHVLDPSHNCLVFDYSLSMRGLLRVLLGQERAIENARSACAALSRQRVEREEVELFLAAHAPRRRVSRTA